jgi:hypothetical protein
MRWLTWFGVVALLIGCVAERSTVPVVIGNDRASAIVVHEDAPTDPRSVVWEYVVIGPNDSGNLVEATAGSLVEVFSESCDPITTITLPTRFAAPPIFLVQEDGSVKQADPGLFGDYGGGAQASPCPRASSD